MVASRFLLCLAVAFGSFALVGCEEPNDKKIEPGNVAADAPRTPEEAQKNLNMKTPDTQSISPYVPPPPPATSK